MGLVVAALFFAATYSAKTEEPATTELITWKKYDEGLKVAAQNKKMVLVDFYTNWCGFCKKMDRETYANKEVARYINDHFVPVKINGESKDPLELPSGTSNGATLARSFAITGYPTTWFLDATGKKLDRIPGYAKPEQFIIVLKYFGEGAYKTQSWEEYYKKMSSANN